MKRIVLSLSLMLGMAMPFMGNVAAETIMPKGEICKHCDKDCPHHQKDAKKPCDCPSKNVVTLKDIVIAHASVRPVSSVKMPTAAYMSIKNTGKQDDVLLRVTSSQAEKIELHNSTVDEQGVMKMTPLEKVAVPAGKMVHFKPHGMHIMVFGLKSVLETGKTLPLTLHFEKSGKVDISFKVAKKAMENCHGKKKDSSKTDSPKADEHAHH